MESEVGDISTALLDALRAELAGVADPTKAEPMRAYMKSSMPYLGAQTPQVRAVCRRVFTAYPLASFEAWRATIVALWRGATYREERYAAIALVGARRYAGYRTLDALPIYEEMIVSGAWWDYVDAVAGLVGALLVAYPTPMRAEMLAWSRDANTWKRRVAITCQLNRGVATDEDLLFACILPNLDDREFFIRKAIGWALRQYARTRPDAVRGFVHEHATRISPLSRREALKHLADTEDR
ncbi:MAG TPA: DNA alkylation repair protein [Ktedonobacterales bacterium]